MTLADAVIVTIVLVLIAGTVALYFWNKRHGKTGCGGHCAGCTRDCAHRQDDDHSKKEE